MKSCFIFLAFFTLIHIDSSSHISLAAKDCYLQSFAEFPESDPAYLAGIDRIRICRSFYSPGYFLTTALINPKSGKNCEAPDYCIVSDPVLLYLERKEKSPPL